MSNNYWLDWQQNRRIEETEVQLASERRARQRLTSELALQQGDLQAQVERLTRAVVALVEHEDIRAELGQYADAAAARRHARDVVANVVVTGRALLHGSVAPSDVPGYWLAAAARGVAASTEGDPAAAGLLEEAARRDPAHTARFLVLLAALTRDPAWAGDHLAEVLPRGGDVDVLQLELWRAATTGRLDPAGDPPGSGRVDEVLVGALSTALAAVPADEVGSRVLARISPLRAAAPSLAAEQAAQQLSRLVDLLGPRDGAAADDHLDDDLDADLDAGATASGSEDPLADCLRSLVDEGSPGERDALERMAVVRADLGRLDRRAAAPSLSWSASAGHLVDLLLADLQRSDDPRRAAIARRVLGPSLDRVAEELLAAAGSTPAATREVQALGRTITVTDEGATAPWQQRVTEGVHARNPGSPFLWQGAIALLVVAVLCTGLAFVAGGWAVLAVPAAVGSAACFTAAVRHRTEVASLVATRLRTVEQDVADAVTRIGTDRERARTAAARARTLRRQVHELLAAPAGSRAEPVSR